MCDRSWERVCRCDLRGRIDILRKKGFGSVKLNFLSIKIGTVPCWSWLPIFGYRILPIRFGLEFFYLVQFSVFRYKMLTRGRIISRFYKFFPFTNVWESWAKGFTGFFIFSLLNFWVGWSSLDRGQVLPLCILVRYWRLGVFSISIKVKIKET